MQSITGVNHSQFDNKGLSEDSLDLLQRLKKINASCFFSSDPILINKLNNVNPVELTKVLHCFFMEMIQKDCIADPVAFLDRLASAIPLSKMQEAVGDNVNDALATAKEMLEEAKLYLQMTNGRTSPGIYACLSSIFEGGVSVLESIITGLGVGDFFKPAENDLHADFKTQKIMMLLSAFTMITTVIVPLLGAATGGLIIGAVFLAITALSIIWPYIKPIPSHLPSNAENWTNQVRNRGFVAEGRKESLDQIANVLKRDRHAILVGPSRVGKSLTAKAFAQAVARGDYPELNGKVVFRINTADLVGHQASFLGGGNKVLSTISDAMGRHRNDIILVLDEIHMACKNNEKMADQLKPLLDEHGEFPHVIGITTAEEYDKHVKECTAFSLRFDRIDIENTKEDETLKILGLTLLRSPCRPVIKDDVIDYIWECRMKGAPQPASSIKILKQCINRTTRTQISPTEKKIIEKFNKIQALRAKAAASRSRKKVARDEIAKLEKELRELQGTLSQEQQNLNKLFKAKDLLDLVTKQMYTTVLKISTIAQATLTTRDEKQIKLFLLLHEFLGKALESHIEQTAKTLDVRVVIDKSLVDEVRNM